MENQTLNILFIGDPHFQIDNLLDVDLFICKIIDLCKERKLDFIVVAGDLLHTHERLHTVVFNKACDFIEQLSNIGLVYVLVGNHDLTSNSEFLTTNHWMNPLKRWKNVVIVDKVININTKHCNFTFVPYVYPGRFEEALHTLSDDQIWKKSDCIFAHQEFKGCKMGSIISCIGDEWDSKYPFVVSGHIHNKQQPQSNIYYPGTPMQHSFGEIGDKTVSILKFDKNKKMTIEDICLQLPTKQIKYINVEDLSTFNKDSESKDKLRLTVKGSYEEFKAMKKTTVYKKLISDGIKIVFKHTDNSDIQKTASDIINRTSNDFMEVLHEIVIKKKDPYLVCEYDKIINNKITEPDNLFFL